MNEDNEEKNNELKRRLGISSVMSIPLLSLSFYESLYFIIYSFITIGLLIYKNTKYPLPPYAINMEGAIIALFILAQIIRNIIIEKAVLNNSPKHAFGYIILSIFVIPCYVFFLRLQTYSLLIDVIINWIGIAFCASQIILSIWIWIVFRRNKSIS
jgi:hypothetical protein